MSPTTLRSIAIMFLATGAVMAVLNLKSVANLGTFYLAPPLIGLGVVFLALSRRRR